jgi:hypothetical protein
MQDTLLLSAPPESSLRRVLGQVSVPLLLFAVSLSFLLLLSEFLLIGRLQKVEVAGGSKSVMEMQALHKSLTASIVSTEEKRGDLLFPERDDLYMSVRALQDEGQTTERLYAEILEQVKGLSSAPDSIHIDVLQVTPDAHTVTLKGDVRFVGPRSMTLLAQFTDSLRRLPEVKALEGETFTRLDDPKMGFHSPFDLTLTLQ